ncbi:hypothetical protein [Streptomyces sp. NRRL WC-3742]|uniref:hypothetical protein n=1 Tax=Streptomyces sp. NRRL WC-3742 TaxID=1463934 RepID=UPI0004CA5E55|nr:hypothetical protein [Streptomyces sp. NRRL WC-3742]
MTESTAGTDRTTETDAEAGAERPSGLQAIWANTTQPVAPLPWYRRVSRKMIIATVVVVGLFTALTVAAVTGAGAPEQHKIVLADRIGDQVRMPDDDLVVAARTKFQRGLTALSPFRDAEVASYGAEGDRESSVLVIGVTGSFPDARTELDRYFGRPTAPGTPSATVRERQDFPVGPLGGALECALLAADAGLWSPVCAWADGTTVGIVTDETGSVELAGLAKRTLVIRAAVEVKAEG